MSGTPISPSGGANAHDPSQPVPPPWSDLEHHQQPAPPKTHMAGSLDTGEGATIELPPARILILAGLEAFGGGVWLLASKSLFDLASYNDYWYGNPGTPETLAQVAVACGLLSLAVAFLFCVVRWPLTWMLGCAFAVATAVVAILWWGAGGNATTAIGIVVVNGAALVYLNTSPMRAIFRRPRLALRRG